MSESGAVSKGIKESLEVLEGLKVVVPAGVEIAADKQLSTKDFAPLMEVIKKYEIIVTAVEGHDELLLEAKDYDMAELAIVGSKFLELVQSIKDAYARGK